MPNTIYCTNCAVPIGVTLRPNVPKIVCMRCFNFEEEWHDHPIAKWYDTMSEPDIKVMIEMINAKTTSNYESRRGRMRYGYLGGRSGNYFKYHINIYYAAQMLTQYGYDFNALWNQTISLQKINSMLRKEQKKHGHKVTV